MRAVVTGVGHHLPERQVSSAEVEELVARASGFRIPSGLLQLLSGVRHRHWVGADDTSSDLAAAAGRRALDAAGVHPAALDLVIFAGASQDVVEPATSAVLQAKLGARGSAIADVKNACNSFITALDMAAALIETGRAGKVLVAAGEVLSPVIDWDVRGMKDLRRKLAGLTLGDAGGAFVLEAADEPAGPGGRGVLPGDFMADGDFWELSTVLGGGSLMRHDHSRDHFDCRSDELAKQALRHLPDLFTKTSERVGWAQAEIALVVPHQVSRAVVVDLARRWNFPLSRCLVTVDRFGNTAAASIPLAVSHAVEAGRIGSGDKVVLVGGAAGFSAGVLPVVW